MEIISNDRVERQKEIKDLMAHNALIRQCYDLGVKNGYGHSDMLEVMVIALAEHNKNLIDELMKIHSQSVRPLILPKDLVTK